MLSTKEKELLKKLIDGTCTYTDFLELKDLKEKGYLKGQYRLSGRAKKELNKSEN